MADPNDPFVQRQRAIIDAADDQILEALNARIDAVLALHEHKVRAGYPLFDPGREKLITSRLLEQNAGPLAADAVAGVVDAILTLTRAEVTRVRQQGWGS